MEDRSSSPNSDIPQRIQELAEEACVDLFEAYGVDLARAELGMTPEGARSLTGIIGFTGPGITGMCLLASSEEPLQASNPANGSLRDWMAELSNQLAGRLKHKLLAQGAEVYVTTPIVLRATRIEPLPRRNLVAGAFRTHNGTLALWVEVETAPEFALSPSGEVAVAEGETLLF